MNLKKAFANASSVLLIFVFVACNGISQQEVDQLTAQAYDDGYDDGYEDGDANGYADGYDQGFVDGQATDADYADGYDDGYVDGYGDGYTDGDADGYSDGYGDGYNDGYDDGFVDGTDVSYDLGYNDGFDDGYDLGFADGDAIGYDDGFNDGYDLGFTDGYDLGYDDGYGDGWIDAEIFWGVGSQDASNVAAKAITLAVGKLVDFSKVKAPVEVLKDFEAKRLVLDASAGLTKNLKKKDAILEGYILSSMKNQIVENYGINEARALQIAKISNSVIKTSHERKLEVSDVNGMAAKVLGSNIVELKKAFELSQKGDSAQLNAVVEKASKLNGLTQEHTTQLLSKLFL
jgi:hypothetical protein